ncbi:MAG: MOSC domain-containing protein [Leptospiraceae bacterium]|nr:MOSC domain-containing protein [Leptospiraceae bacterium]MCB1315461.1 MOSC domain-containing protein [Leptospiraceae bacterium]
MRILSVNVGLPRDLEWQGKIVRTGFIKEPVNGPVRVVRYQLEGDGQADLRVHGGADKAVYAYPGEHYADWQSRLNVDDLPAGAFGENLTTSGFMESEVCIGDRYAVGSAELVVTQPRTPCFKLNVRFQREDMLEMFLNSDTSGIYFTVHKEGQLAAGDELRLLERHPDCVTVRDAMRLKMKQIEDADLLERILSIESLAQSWRADFEKRRAKLRGE